MRSGYDRVTETFSTGELGLENQTVQRAAGADGYPLLVSVVLLGSRYSAVEMFGGGLWCTRCCCDDLYCV